MPVFDKVDAFEADAREVDARKAGRLKAVRIVAAVAALSAVGPLTTAAHAQGKADAPKADSATTGAATEAPQPKQVALDQKTIDGLIAAQKEMRDIDAKAPKDAKQPDSKLVGQVDATIKKNGFANVEQFADASYSVGVVLAGIDPDTGKFIGVEAATKKQIDDVTADKDMPPKEKKEALAELNESLKSATTEKPLPANIPLVESNFKKLNEGLQQAD